MDLPLRTRLQGSFVGVALVSGALTLGVGSVLIRKLGLGPDERNIAIYVLFGSACGALLVAFLVANFLAIRLATRINTVTGAAVELEHGNLEARVPEPEHAQQDEIKRLQVIFNAMAEALQQRDDELRTSHAQLAQATDELQQWNQSYLNTLQFITHELKNQIASAKLNLAAVHDGYVGALNQEQKEALEDVMSTVNHTEDMLVNYLNLSRIEKGELQVRTRPVQVEPEVVKPVLRGLHGMLAERQMQVEVDLPPDLITQGDPTLLQTVYENLISNAAKYGRAGGRIRLWGKPVNGMLEMHVWNEGPGVSEDRIGELFGKFSRLQPPGEEVRGSGLGLFIDREIVRKHGGEIWAQSQFGEWIDFIFTLPRPDEMLQQPVIT
jgi:signal transduction histidine kinase